MKVWSKANHTFNIIIERAADIAKAILLFDLALICTAVVMRYFLKRPIIWTVEIVELLLLFIALLSAAWALKRGSHIRMDLLVSRLNPARQAVLRFLTSILGASLSLLLAWYGALVTWQRWQGGHVRGATIEVPDHYVLFIIPVGFGMLFIQFLIMMYEDFRKFRSTK